MAENTTGSEDPLLISCPQDYFLCEDELGGGCCPAGYVCGERTCQLPASVEKGLMEPVGPCPNFEGYSACHEDTGGNCCPVNYACFENGCMFTQRIQAGPVTATVTRSGIPLTMVFESTNGSAAMSLARLKTEVTAPLAQPTESSEGAEVTAPNSSSSTWSQGALIAVIIAPIIAVVFLAIGIFFIIRRHRGRPKGNGQSVHDGAQNNDDGPTAHEKNTEIEAKTELSSNGHFAWEMPADRGTMELSRHNEAWELENTQTTPELPASHGMAEMDARRDGGLRGSRRG